MGIPWVVDANHDGFDPADLQWTADLGRVRPNYLREKRKHNSPEACKSFRPQWNIQLLQQLAFSTSRKVFSRVETGCVCRDGTFCTVPTQNGKPFWKKHKTPATLPNSAFLCERILTVWITEELEWEALNYESGMS